MITGNPGNFTIRWPSYLTNYQLQFTTDLNAGPWMPETSLPVRDADTLTTTVPASPLEPRRFWRLRGPD
ncbi:MAG: hypothetical protein V4726_18920 [Verrucomicrobiota bacterium]